MYTIVIPTLKSLHLGNTLVALQGQTFFDQIDEIIVVGQQEGLDWRRFPKTRYIFEETNPTPSHNRNIGVQSSNSDWVCFIDSDCIPQPDWLEQFSRQKKASEQLIYAGTVGIPKLTDYWSKCDHYFVFENQAIGMDRKGEIKNAATINLMIARATFLSVGGFDEGFIKAAGEDTDLCRRLRECGYKIVLVKNALVLHNHGRCGFQSFWEHSYIFGVNQAHVWHKESRRLWRIIQSIIKIPIIGEFGAIGRLILRFIFRPIRNPRYIRVYKLIPGIFLLDVAHSLGIIKGTRNLVR